MIFYLDSSLKSVNDGNVHAHFIDFIENLCVARKNGRHIIYSDVSTLESLISLKLLGDRARATLVKLSRRVRGKLAIFEACFIYIKVVADPGTFQKVLLPNGKEEIRISTDAVLGDDIFTRTRLLAENRTDGMFYGGLAKMSLHNHPQLKNVILNYEIVAGGGSQTPREYQNLKASRNLTLCIVDSDVDYQGAPLGGNTAAPIYNMDCVNPAVTAKSLILNCYSAENLIHPVIIKRAMKLGGNETWYKQLDEYYRKDFWMYLALKSKKVCIDFHAVDDKTSYWLSKRADFAKVPCHPVCDPDKCKIFEPLKGKTLEKAAIFLEGQEYSFLSDIDFNGHGIFVEWNAITKNLLSWACSGDRISSL